MRNRRLGAYASLGALLLLTGCGYSTLLGPPMGHRKLGVELFENDSKVPDIERDLHSALTAAVRTRVDSQLVRPSEATAVIYGRVVEYGRRSGIRSAQNEWLESAVVLTVEATLEDETGKVLSRAYLSNSVGFTFGLEGGETAAAHRAVENLAERIVLELFVRAGG